jgi:hypothetical protein
MVWGYVYFSMKQNSGCKPKKISNEWERKSSVRSLMDYYIYEYDFIEKCLGYYNIYDNFLINWCHNPYIISKKKINKKIWLTGQPKII